MTAARRLVMAALTEPMADRVAFAAREALLAELNTWPKPGLVSQIDRGSHTDMDAGLFEASADAIAPYFGQLTRAGAAGATMNDLRRIGLAAEQAMMAATGGINTHRGAIFALGLLCAAAGASWEGPWHAGLLCDKVRHLWGASIQCGPIPLRSHGTDALRRFGAGGARAQAAAGFPHACDIGLAALRQIRTVMPEDPEAARVQAFFALLASMEDTNLLHRGGLDGLIFARAAAKDFLDQGGVCRAEWCDQAVGIHLAFIARRLSPGGCADLLAVTLLLDALEELR